MNKGASVSLHLYIMYAYHASNDLNAEAETLN